MSPEAPILIGYDGTAQAAGAIRAAGRLLGPRPAIVACAWIPMAVLDRHDPLAAHLDALTPPGRELDGIAAELAGKHAAEGAQLARESGLDAGGAVVRADRGAWRALAELAEARDAAAIVVATGSAAHLEGRLLGSTARSLVSRAGRPVLTIPPGPAED